MSTELKKASSGFGFIWSILLFLIFGVVVLIFWPRSTDQTLDQKRATGRLARLDLLNKLNHQKLAGYAWVNKDKGVVQLPIDHAMELVAVDLAAKPVKASAVKVEVPYPYGLQQPAVPAPAPAGAPAAGGTAAPATAAPSPAATGTAAPAAPAPNPAPAAATPAPVK